MCFLSNGHLLQLKLFAERNAQVVPIMHRCVDTQAFRLQGYEIKQLTHLGRIRARVLAQERAEWRTSTWGGDGRKFRVGSKSMAEVC